MSSGWVQALKTSRGRPAWNSMSALLAVEGGDDGLAAG